MSATAASERSDLSEPTDDSSTGVRQPRLDPGVALLWLGPLLAFLTALLVVR